jgi:NAD(P)-dependent dehydrogenase (short-subunit alcohol dehydrogenase family)
VGRYVARTFALEGASVAIADIAPMDIVTQEITELGADVLPVKTDITREVDVRSLMEQVHSRWGRIDVLINDAGINPHFHIGKPRWPRIRDMPIEHFNKVLDTNLLGTFLCTKHVLPYMEALNDGHIINFGQGNVSEERRPGAYPNIGMGIYNVSKVSIRAFTRYVADEEREFNVCIMSMGPGGSIRSDQPLPPAKAGPGIPGGGAGIVTEDSPEWARQREGAVHVDAVGNRYVIAAEAAIEFTGHQVFVQDGKLYIATD